MVFALHRRGRYARAERAPAYRCHVQREFVTTDWEETLQPRSNGALTSRTFHDRIDSKFVPFGRVAHDKYRMKQIRAAN